MNHVDQINRPAPGVQVVPAVACQPGIHMAEGRLSALIWGEGCQSYYVEMPAGAYLEEHPHSFEALIYAVHGRFVLCNGGQRQVLEEETLMSFGADIVTSYEVPFDEPAGVLVFRMEPPEEDQATFLSRLAKGRPLTFTICRQSIPRGPSLVRSVPRWIEIIHSQDWTAAPASTTHLSVCHPPDAKPEKRS